MFVRIKNRIEYTLKNTFVSWKTKRRIIVIESDDWGSVRISSPEVYQKLLSMGIPVDKIHYTKYDALESEDDLAQLFDTLLGFKDKNNRSPVFTANCLMANPDFKKIRDNDFTSYFYQPVEETFASYPKHANSLKLWMEGNRNGVFHPQFHGREHVNVGRWMKALRSNLPETRLAFDNGVFGISMHGSTEERESYMEALVADTKEQVKEIHDSVIDGLQLFEKTIGYRSESFIAPNYKWSADLEKTLFKEGVRYIQGNRMQIEASQGANLKIRKVNYTGKKNELGQTYLVRNCHFEPSSGSGRDWVDYCLKQIATAFRADRPAIICSHRVNFVGYLDERNRSKNLKLLDKLLGQIIANWPDVEFLSSDEVGQLIDKK